MITAKKRVQLHESWLKLNQLHILYCPLAFFFPSRHQAEIYLNFIQMHCSWKLHTSLLFKKMIKKKCSNGKTRHFHSKWRARADAAHKKKLLKIHTWIICIQWSCKLFFYPLAFFLRSNKNPKCNAWPAKANRGAMWCNINNL